jgi:hypothetical protein
MDMDGKNRPETKAVNPKTSDEKLSEELLDYTSQRLPKFVWLRQLYADGPAA